MKFLMIVLAIHTVVKMIGNKRKTTTETKAGEINEKIFHPAEFILR